jgi:actin-related protein 5
MNQILATLFFLKFAHNDSLAIGGVQTSEYILKLLQHKYPDFPIKMTPYQAQELLYKYSYIPENFIEELKQFESFEGLASRDQIVDVPHPPLVWIF